MNENALTERIATYLDETVFEFARTDGSYEIRAKVYGVSLLMWVILHSKQPDVQFRICFAGDVPRRRRRVLTDAVAMMNLQLAFGRFDFDREKGLVSYFASIPCLDGPITAVQFHNALSLSTGYAADFGAGLLHVIRHSGLGPGDGFVHGVGRWMSRYESHEFFDYFKDASRPLVWRPTGPSPSDQWEAFFGQVQEMKRANRDDKSLRPCTVT